MVGRIHNHKLSQAEKIAIASCSGRTTPIGTTVPAVGRLMKNHTLYHSLLHQRGGPRNNSLCMFETADEQGFAVIDYFCLLSSSQPLAILQVFERTAESILKSIRPPRTQELKVLTTAKLLSNHVIEVKKLSQASINQLLVLWPTHVCKCEQIQFWLTPLRTQPVHPLP